MLVTGATGLVGSLADAAPARSRRRRGLPGARLGAAERTGARRHASTGSRWCAATSATATLLERALGEYEIDTVFHLAAQTIVGIANRNPVSTFESNIQGTWNVLEACRRSPGGAARSWSPPRTRPTATRNSCPTPKTTPLQGRHPYDVSKSCADLIAQTYATTYGLPVAITRCGNFYGGGDLNWNRIVPGTIRSVLRGERPVIRSDGQYRPRLFLRRGRRRGLHAAGRAAALPTRTARRRPSTSPTRAQVTVLELVKRILQPMDSDLEPDVRNEASTRSATSILSAARARQRARLGARCSLSTRAWTAPSPGIEEFLSHERPSRTSCGQQILDLVRRVLREALSRRGHSCPGETPVPVAGTVFDAAEMRIAGRLVARFLADHRPLRRPVRTRVRPLVRRPRLPCWSTPGRPPTCWRCLR